MFDSSVQMRATRTDQQRREEERKAQAPQEAARAVNAQLRPAWTCRGSIGGKAVLFPSHRRDSAAAACLRPLHRKRPCPKPGSASSDAMASAIGWPVAAW
ncbi:hypothetical protein GCM10010440_72010 [Kitasatospora cinereorecta]